MKKLLITLICLLALAACTDARATLKKNEKLLQVGKESITEKEIFELMTEKYGADTVIAMINDFIYEKVADAQEDFTERIESYSSLYAALYGPTYYQAFGFASEAGFKAKLLQDYKTETITKKYLENNFEAVVENYRPTKLAILQFDEYDDAAAALKSAKNGIPLQELAEEFKATEFSSGAPNIYTTSSNLSPEVISFGLYAEETGLVDIPLFSGDGKYYIVQVINVNRSSYKAEIIEVLTEVSSIADDAIKYYCEFYQLTYYDKNTVERLVYTNPSYLR